jgi:hypothetical protein
MRVVGGSAYLTQIDLGPAAECVRQHAETVRTKWRTRQLIQVCQNTAGDAYASGEVDRLAENLRQFIDGEHVRAPDGIAPVTNASLCEAIMGAGPRIPLGVAPLDDKLHGGMRIRKLMGVGGAPGAWKTSLLVQIADHLSQQPGVGVAWAAYDECAEEVMSRRLQARGIERCRCESPDEGTLVAARELDALPFHVFENKPFDEVIGLFSRMYPNLDRFVFIDSAQKMWTHESRQLQTARERIDVALGTCRTLAESPATQCAILLTSEVSRGSYRSRNGAEQTDDLAAGKESGSIEYGLDVWCVLRSSPGELGDTVTMTVPKNRIGACTVGDEVITFSPDRVRVHLCALSDVALEELRSRAANDELSKAKGRLLDALRQNPSGLGSEELRIESRLRRDTFWRVVRQLLASGLIIKDESGRSHKAVWRTA